MDFSWAKSHQHQKHTTISTNVSPALYRRLVTVTLCTVSRIQNIVEIAISVCPRSQKEPRDGRGYGQAPDNFTGWGLYFQEGIDLLRLCSWGFFAFVFSLSFGICWALRSKSVQDGFAIASYILAFEALVVGSIQAAIKLNIF